MATYQLAGLPSFQTSNSNAPSAQPVEVPTLAPKENMGVNLANAVGSIYNSYQQGEAVQKGKAFQEAFGKAYASGDTDAMQKLAETNPEQIQAIQQGMGMTDENNRRQIGQAAAELHTAALSNDPTAVQNAITRNEKPLALAGVTPGEAFNAYNSNPAQFANYANLIGVHALQPKDYYQYQQQQQQLGQRGQIAGANIELKRQELNQRGQYQDAQLAQGQQKIDIDRNQLGINQSLADVKRLEAQNKANSNSVAGQANQQKLIGTKQTAVSTYDNGLSTLQNSLDAIGAVKQIKPEVFDRVFGFGGKINSSIPGGESADAWTEINRLQSQARLMGMQSLRGTGSVTETEGKAAQQALLSINQSMSPKAARKAIDQYFDVLNRAQQGYQKQAPLIDRYRDEINSYTSQSAGGQQAPQPGTVQGGYTFLGGDPSNPNSWRQN